MFEIEKLATQIKPVNNEYEETAKNYISHLTMPHWALGDLLDIGTKLWGIYEKLPPIISRKKVFIFAADHGITAEGVSLFPKEVTTQMVENFVNQGAAINVLSKHANMDLFFVDMGVGGESKKSHKKLHKKNHKQNNFVDKKIASGTKNFFEQDAMNEEQARKSLQVGFDLIKDHHLTTDIFAIGEMGIGNTTTAAAMAAALLGTSVEDVTGHGTGIDKKMYHHKIKVIKESLEKRKINSELSPLEVLTRIGGFEIGAMAGACMGCAYYSKPLIVDGFISSVSALLAQKFQPRCTQYMFLAHASKEKGHKKVYEQLQLKPILDLNMRLGEGSGTPLAMNIIEASTKILRDMATFESAGVSQA